ncbi:5-formyltetrahydrofolate cyclo-ligase [Solicola sp. PLA-1-18]|uniref:5-formyltetrahydrofolate cyclo-ligase n=1 Tax=Solicola sp. PLA-1-18 TaxID=3380532 RepID=UPI003B7D1D6B
MSEDVGAAKDELRRQVTASRAARSVEDLDVAGHGLAAVLLASPLLGSARTVAAYVSFGTEPPTGPLLDGLRDAGVRVLLPLVRPAGVLDWALDDGALSPGGLGIPEPAGEPLGPSALATADVVLVPALAADAAGHRLGRGAGYYDRALASLPPGVPVVVVVFDADVVAHVPTEPHDVPATHLATPTSLTPTP